MVSNSPEDENLKEILKFMKKTIKETKLPWVSWRLLEDNAEKIIGKRRRPESDLWNAMAPVTRTLLEGEEEPKAKAPMIYEYKIGNSWVYFPAKVIELYCESEEL